MNEDMIGKKFVDRDGIEWRVQDVRQSNTSIINLERDGGYQRILTEREFSSYKPAGGFLGETFPGGAPGKATQCHIGVTASNAAKFEMSFLAGGVWHSCPPPVYYVRYVEFDLEVTPKRKGGGILNETFPGGTPSKRTGGVE